MALIPLGSGRFADDPDTRFGAIAMRHQNSVFHGLLKHLPRGEFDRWWRCIGPIRGFAA
jgi:hypothetical protein